MLLQDALQRISRGDSLTRDQARELMGAILRGESHDDEIANLLLALNKKGESVDEIVGFAEAMRAAAPSLKVSDSSVATGGTGRSALVDTCGTGGDARGTFNISTATALVVAGAGVRVAKHGNRSVSSQCGSADVMEALGVNVNTSVEQMSACLEQVGISFLYAPRIHTATHHAQAARAKLQTRTVFNLLGPLTNPAGASAQVVGVYSRDLVEKLACALQMLGAQRALVVHGSDGLDEITLGGATYMAELRDGELSTGELTPEEFGIARASLNELQGGDAKENAAIIRNVLANQHSARRDVVLLNAAAALWMAGRAATMKDALPLAEESLASGKARIKLQKLVEFTNS